MELDLDPHSLSDNEYSPFSPPLPPSLWPHIAEDLLASPQSSDSEDAPGSSHGSTAIGQEEETTWVLCGVCKKNTIQLPDNLPVKRTKTDTAIENVCADCLKLTPAELPKYRNATSKSKRVVKREHAKRRNKDLESEAVKKLKVEQEEIAGKDLPDVEKKRLQQVVRNRISAQQSRDRKKAYVDQLESEKKELESRNLALEQKVARLKFENRLLRRQLVLATPPETIEMMPVAPATRTVRNVVTIALATVISVVALVNTLPDPSVSSVREALVALDLKDFKNESGATIVDATNQVLKAMNLNVEEIVNEVIETNATRVLNDIPLESPIQLDSDLFFDLSSIRSSLVHRIQDKTAVTISLRGSHPMCENARELLQAYEENTLATMFCPNARFYTAIGDRVQDMLKMVQMVVPVNSMLEVMPEFRNLPANCYLELLCKVIDVNVIPAK